MDFLEHYIWGVLVGLVVAAPVGPVNVLCIHRTLTKGRVNGFLTGLGAAAGDTLFAALAVFGLARISALVTEFEHWIRLPGGLFLILMGIVIWRGRAKLQAPKDEPARLKRGIAASFTMTITNPITIAAFVAIFLSWGLAANLDESGAIGLISGVATGSTLWWLILVALTGLLHGQLNDGHLKWFNRVNGLLMVSFGIYALISVAPNMVSAASAL